MGAARTAVAPPARAARKCCGCGRSVFGGVGPGSPDPPSTSRSEADSGSRRGRRSRRAAALVGARPGTDGVVLGCGFACRRRAPWWRRRLRRRWRRCGRWSATAACGGPGAHFGEPPTGGRDRGHGREGHPGPASARGDVCRQHERCCRQAGFTESRQFSGRNSGTAPVPESAPHQARANTTLGNTARSKAAGPPGPTAGDGGSHRPAAGAVPRSAPLRFGAASAARSRAVRRRAAPDVLPEAGFGAASRSGGASRAGRASRSGPATPSGAAPRTGAAPSIVVPGIRHRWTGAGRTPTAESPTAESPTAVSPTAEHRSERAGPDFRNQPSASATASVVRRAWSRPPTKVSPPAAPTSTSTSAPGTGQASAVEHRLELAGPMFHDRAAAAATSEARAATSEARAATSGAGAATTAGATIRRSPLATGTGRGGLPLASEARNDGLPLAIGERRGGLPRAVDALPGRQAPDSEPYRLTSRRGGTLRGGPVAPQSIRAIGVQRLSVAPNAAWRTPSASPGPQAQPRTAPAPAPVATAAPVQVTWSAPAGTEAPVQRQSVAPAPAAAPAPAPGAQNHHPAAALTSTTPAAAAALPHHSAAPTTPPATTPPAAAPPAAAPTAAAQSVLLRSPAPPAPAAVAPPTPPSIDSGTAGPTGTRPAPTDVTARTDAVSSPAPEPSPASTTPISIEYPGLIRRSTTTTEGGDAPAAAEVEQGTGTTGADAMGTVRASSANPPADAPDVEVRATQPGATTAPDTEGPLTGALLSNSLQVRRMLGTQSAAGIPVASTSISGIAAPQDIASTRTAASAVVGWRGPVVLRAMTASARANARRQAFVPDRTQVPTTPTRSGSTSQKVQSPASESEIQRVVSGDIRPGQVAAAGLRSAPNGATLKSSTTIGPSPGERTGIGAGRPSSPGSTSVRRSIAPAAAISPARAIPTAGATAGARPTLAAGATAGLHPTPTTTSAVGNRRTLAAISPAADSPASTTARARSYSASGAVGGRRTPMTASAAFTSPAAAGVTGVRRSLGVSLPQHLQGSSLPRAAASGQGQRVGLVRAALPPSMLPPSSMAGANLTAAGASRRPGAARPSPAVGPTVATGPSAAAIIARSSRTRESLQYNGIDANQHRSSEQSSSDRSSSNGPHHGSNERAGGQRTAIGRNTDSRSADDLTKNDGRFTVSGGPTPHGPTPHGPTPHTTTPRVSDPAAEYSADRRPVARAPSSSSSSYRSVAAAAAATYALPTSGLSTSGLVRRTVEHRMTRHGMTERMTDTSQVDRSHTVRGGTDLRRDYSSAGEWSFAPAPAGYSLPMSGLTTSGVLRRSTGLPIGQSLSAPAVAAVRDHLGGRPAAGGPRVRRSLLPALVGRQTGETARVQLASSSSDPARASSEVRPTKSGPAKSGPVKSGPVPTAPPCEARPSARQPGIQPGIQPDRQPGRWPIDSASARSVHVRTRQLRHRCNCAS